MSKWNKQAKPLTDQFLQNQERRRQMIIQASKRRRQKQKKLQQLNENLKKNEQQALQKHKKQKQEAYNKYLKKNNMHDKYEQIKRNEKMQQQPAKKQVSKWKRRNNSDSKISQQPQLQNYADKYSKQLHKKQQKAQIQPKKGMQTKKVVVQQFQKQWADQQIQEQMIGSKLIDSLDLDIDTLERGRELSKKIQKIKNNSNQKPTIDVSEVKQIKNLIGYDSMLVSMDDNISNPNTKQPQQSKNTKPKPEIAKKQLNQQQTFNNLKHKKQAKIFEWANSNKIVQEADDLFSNCSTNKNSVQSKQISKDTRTQNKQLQTIHENNNKANSNKSIEKQKNINKFRNQNDQKLRVIDKNNSSEKQQNNSQKKKQIRNISQANNIRVVKSNDQKLHSQKNIRGHIGINLENQNTRDRSISKQKIKQNQAILQQQRKKSLQKLKNRRYSGDKPSSAQKPRLSSQQQKPNIPKTQQPFRMHKAPPIPSKPIYSVATHQQYFDVESFIKNDLLQLNQQERQLQQQIRDIHINNKQKVKQVQNKYQIKTNYKNSAQLASRHNGQQVQDRQHSYAQQHLQNNINEDMIQQSLQRLDDLLIKRQIDSRQKVDTQNSNLKGQQKSLINPFSKPEDLHKQILQLAQNISKFENEPAQNIKGYAYQKKLKNKQKVKQGIPQQISQSRNIDEQHVKRPSAHSKMSNPPILSYSNRNNDVVDVNMEDAYYDPQDSLQSGKKEKIKVNEKLKNILFDN